MLLHHLGVECLNPVECLNLAERPNLAECLNHVECLNHALRHEVLQQVVVLLPLVMELEEHHLVVEPLIEVHPKMINMLEPQRMLMELQTREVDMWDMVPRKNPKLQSMIHRVNRQAHMGLHPINIESLYLIHKVIKRCCRSYLDAS